LEEDEFRKGVTPVDGDDIISFWGVSYGFSFELCVEQLEISVVDAACVFVEDDIGVTTIKLLTVIDFDTDIVLLSSTAPLSLSVLLVLLLLSGETNPICLSRINVVIG